MICRAAPSPCRLATLGAPGPHDRRTATPPRCRTPGTLGLPARTVRPFSLLGVVWDDAAAELRGRVQVRTRATGTASGPTGRTSRSTTTTPPTSAPPSGTAAAYGAAPPRCGSATPTPSSCASPPRPAHRAPATVPAGLRLELVDPGRTPRRRPRRARRPAGGPARRRGGRGLRRQRRPRPARRHRDPGPRPGRLRGRHRRGGRAVRRPHAAIGPRPAHRHPGRLGRRRAPARKGLHLHPHRPRRLRPPQRLRQQLHLRRGPCADPRHVPLPRHEQPLAGHRLQLPHRQVRHGLRGPGGRRRQARHGRPHPRLQLRQHRHRRPRHLHRRPNRPGPPSTPSPV